MAADDQEVSSLKRLIAAIKAVGGDASVEEAALVASLAG